tara:strand:- start:279 stop:782 length:504 start_codon:yes stop_codon:yes gene_type:complete
MVLTAEEKRERQRIANKKYRAKNKEKIALKDKEYREKNKEKLHLKKKEYREKNREKINLKYKKYREENKEKEYLRYKEYSQTHNGKKINKLRSWKHEGLIASNEELDRIYNLSLNQEFCNACDVKLTRTGKNCKTNVTMDHDHSNGRFRHIICNTCNVMDSWKKYFC